MKNQFLLDSSLSKNLFFIILHRQNVKVGAFALCWKICFWERCFWKKNHILNRKLWKQSEFESTFPQLLKLGIENFKTCRFWNWISTWRRNSNQGFDIHQILMKKLFLENQNLFEKSLSNNQLSDQFTLQKRRSWRSRATLISFSAKSCFHFKKKTIFWIKAFKIFQILTQFLTNASDFESRNSKLLYFEPFFHNSTKFESKFLERVSFLNQQVAQRIRFWSEIVLFENRFWWKLCFQILTLGSSNPVKSRLLPLCAFPTSNRREKNSLWINFFERNQILKQVYNNATDLGSRISQYVRILANFTQLVLFWIGIFLACLILNHFFTVRQILNRNFNNLTDFHVNFFWKINFCWTVRYQKIYFFIILHRQNVKLGAFVLCWKIRFWERCFWKGNHILNRKLWRESEFESTFSKLLKLGIENFKTCRFWNWISTWRRKLNQSFHIH